MRILVTGITGFAGSHLAELLLSEPGVELFGLSKRGTWPNEASFLKDRVTLHECDLCDRSRTESLLRVIQPETVYHLAGYTRTDLKDRDAEVAWQGNLTTTRCLYSAIEQWGKNPRVLYVSSGLVYGPCEDPEQAHNECCPLRPMSHYAASKAAADLVSYQYTRSPNLDIVRARPFNHIGPRQSPGFAIPDWAQQLVAIERGQKPAVLETRDLSPHRDFTDVRDVVRAYRLLAEHGRAGEVYNVGTGQGVCLQDVLERLLALARVRVNVRRLDGREGPAGPNVTRADSTRLRRLTGWAPMISLEQSLIDILSYWRQRW